MNKVGLISLVLLLALGSLGISYAGWSNNLTISGTMKTASLPTSVYKAPSLSIPTSGQFTNPENAFSQNLVYTYCTSAKSQQYANFGFNIPVGSTIQGIQIDVIGYCNNSDAYITASMSSNGGSSFSATKTTTSFKGTSYMSNILGGNADLWGTAWSRTDISDLNFRLKLNSTGNMSGGHQFRIDYVKVTIYYTPP